jgi:hypothetical protein
MVLVAVVDPIQMEVIEFPKRNVNSLIFGIHTLKLTRSKEINTGSPVGERCAGIGIGGGSNPAKQFTLRTQLFRA